MSNIVLNPGSLGATLATDQVGGVDFQKVKVTFATDGSAPVSVDSSNGLPVAVVGTVPVSAASLPLPAGAATAAKQPALGTAGSASADVISIQGVASMTAVKVDGSGVTQPVSGTVTANAGSGTMAVSVASLPLPSGASTAAKQPALGTAGSASTDVLTIQGIASMTKLLVTPDSVALPANQSVNVNQIAGNAPKVGSGNGSTTGSLNVYIATDQPALTNALKVDPSAVTSPVSIAATVTVNDAPIASGGLSRNYQIAPATPAKTVVKASAGTLYAIKASNDMATPAYVKLFDALTGSVTLGTTACDDQFEIPGNTAGAGFVYEVNKGIAFSTGIVAAVTGAIASADNTSITASKVILTLYYK